MPTREAAESFWRDWRDLSLEQQAAFLVAVAKFIADLRARRGFRAGLRVKGVRGNPGVYELTWAQDGRATFSYGRSVVGDEPHIIWRRGTHDPARAVVSELATHGLDVVAVGVEEEGRVVAAALS